MLIFKNFIILNYPKTGTTFLRKTLRKIHEKRLSYKVFGRLGFKELLLDHPLIDDLKHPHGTYSEIPSGLLKNRAVMSTVRNPYSRFKSLYTFKWWANHPRVERNMILERFPHFPELTLEEFIQYSKLELEADKKRHGVNADVEIGDQSLTFIKFYAQNPSKVFSLLNQNGGLTRTDVEQNFKKIKFLRQEHLNDDLKAFLKTQSYSQSEIALIDKAKKLNVSDREGHTHIDERIIKHVNNNEQILFDLLDYYGISYKSNEYC